MTAQLETVDGFRLWAGANVPANVPDSLIQDSLNEAEAGLVVDVRCGTVTAIRANPDATVVALGEVRRRTQNLLAKRNSPEGVSGIGDEGFISIPVIPPGSMAAVRQIKTHLGISLVVIA